MEGSCHKCYKGKKCAGYLENYRKWEEIDLQDEQGVAVCCCIHKWFELGRVKSLQEGIGLPLILLTRGSLTKAPPWWEVWPFARVRDICFGISALHSPWARSVPAFFGWFFLKVFAQVCDLITLCKLLTVGLLALNTIWQYAFNLLNVVIVCFPQHSHWCLFISEQGLVTQSVFLKWLEQKKSLIRVL